MTDTVTRLYYPAETYRILQENIAAAKTIPNMVYDEEASYSAAFCCSDAQISDYSSLMFQYLLLDKPVLWTLGPDDTFRRENPEFFIDWRWMEEARQAEDVLSFMERVRQGTLRLRTGAAGSGAWKRFGRQCTQRILGICNHRRWGISNELLCERTYSKYGQGLPYAGKVWILPLRFE